jgi:DNA replication protein DnaC
MQVSHPARQHHRSRAPPPRRREHAHHRCDDFALQPLDETATTDFYELHIVARHRKNATIVTSNHAPDEWLALMHDQLLAQSAVDRLTSACHELIVDGPSYRQRQRPARTST